jgi:DNA-binding CsgD family transcriptional regulator
MGQQDMVERVLGSLYDAMLDEAYWPATSALIDEACGVKGNALVVSDGQAEDADIYFTRICYRGRHDPDLERLYFESYYATDERVPRIRQLPDSKLVPVSDLYTQDELKTSPTYNEMLPRAASQNGLNVRMDGPRGSQIIWRLADPIQSGAWSQGQIEMIGRLIPHVRQFVQVRHALISAEAPSTSLTELLHNAKVGAIHLNRRGQILAANDRARNLFRQGDVLSDGKGLLGARMATDQARLERLLARALPKYGGEAAGGSVTVRRLGGLSPLKLHVNPVKGQGMALSAGSVAAHVLIVDPEGLPGVHPELVAGILGLTPMEGRIATLLAVGKTIPQIALAVNRGESCVRRQVKQICEKQGVSCRVDLVRLVLALIGLGGTGAERVN